MSYGYIGDTSTSIKQQVKNAGVLSMSDVLDLEGKGHLGGSLELIEEQTVSGVATVDFTSIKENVYNVHLLQLSNYQHTDTSSGFAGIRFYESGVLETGSVYQIAYQRGDSSGAFGILQSTTNAQLVQFRNFGGADSNHSGNGYSYFYNLGNSSKYSFQTTHSSYLDNSSNAEFTMGGGVLPQASTVNGIRIFAGAGNLSATIKLYGVKQI